MTDHAPLDPADIQTAAAVKAAFADVHMTRDFAGEAPRSDLAARIPHPRRRRWVAAASAVAASAVAVMIGSVALSGTSAAAWAAVPTAPTASDITTVVNECAVPTRDAGDSRAEGPAANGVPIAVSESNLRVLDMRGIGAIAIFGKGDASYACTLALIDDAWVFAGAVGSDAASPLPAGATAAMSTRLPNGSDFSSLHGYVDAGVVRVMVTLADGLEAQASLGATGSGQHFAVWFPVAIDALAGARIVATDESGGVQELDAPQIAKGDRADVPSDAR